MKKYITGSLAIILALVCTFGFSAFKNNHSGKHPSTTDYYYQFTGTHGNENNMSLWVQLSTLSAYNTVSCNAGSNNSCKIINNTNSGAHPTSVPLDGSGFPQIGSVNSARVLKQ